MRLNNYCKEFSILSKTEKNVSHCAHMKFCERCKTNSLFPLIQADYIYLVGSVTPMYHACHVSSIPISVFDVIVCDIFFIFFIFSKIEFQRSFFLDCVDIVNKHCDRIRVVFSMLNFSVCISSIDLRSTYCFYFYS